MKDWKNVVLTPQASIREAISTIDAGALQIALVVDSSFRLLGTVTDGDIRRGILAGISFDGTVRLVMNDHPIIIHETARPEEILRLMRDKALHQIPVIDDLGRLVGLEVIENLFRPTAQPNQVIIMAGGLGARLRPMTNNCPKPMLKIGGKPILETVLERFLEQGFSQFYFAVNYMADMIKEYFGDGSRYGAEIRYLQEKERLGTAGALSLLPERPTKTILVMNGDLLTKVNFQQLLSFHREHSAVGTMCVREYDFQVPYGVVMADQHRLLGIEEKPVQKFFVNAGIYALDPCVINMIVPNEYCDMPSIFERLIQERRESAVFPIREYWLDIGRLDDFERANSEYLKFF